MTHRNVRIAAVAVIVLSTVMLHSAFAAAAQPTTRPLRVAIYSDGGSNDKAYDNVSHCLSLAAEQFKYTRITAGDIRDGKLKDFDVLVQGGGSGSAQAKALQDNQNAHDPAAIRQLNQHDVRRLKITMNISI